MLRLAEHVWFWPPDPDPDRVRAAPHTGIDWYVDAHSPPMPYGDLSALLGGHRANTANRPSARPRTAKSGRILNP